MEANFLTPEEDNYKYKKWQCQNKPSTVVLGTCVCVCVCVCVCTYIYETMSLHRCIKIKEMYMGGYAYIHIFPSSLYEKTYKQSYCSSNECILYSNLNC